MAARRKRTEKKKGDLPMERDSLRIDAEKVLAQSPGRSPAKDGRSPEEIVHELQVHQIELEMQNEALREAHLALEASSDKYIDLYEFAPVGYLTLTERGVIGEANLTGAAMLGAERRDLVRSRFAKYVDPADLHIWNGYFAAVLHSTEKQKCELVLRKSDGTRFNGRVESLRIAQGQEKALIRVTISDITAEKQAEAELIRKSDEISAANEDLTRAAGILREKETRLTALVAEKEALLAEVHHRVKNNLAAFISLLSLNSAYEDTEQGRNLKKDLQNRARSMALIHDTLFRTGNFSQVDMEVYLTVLAKQVAASYAGSGNIRTIVEARGTVLDLSRATTVGLIVNEIITNSYKYAFPPAFDCLLVRGEPCTIRITLRQEEESLVLSVEDNGTGLPPGFDPLASKSLGLKLVNFLARHQLHAETGVIGGKGTGFEFRLARQKEVCT